MGYRTGLGRHCWYVGRTIEIAQLMRPILQSGGHNSTFVVESQASAPSVTRTVISCLSNSTDVDAIGIAPYFDGYDPAINDLGSIRVSYERAVNETLDDVRLHFELAASAGYQLVTYEAGPDGKGNGTAQDLAIAAHRQPWMGALTRRYYRALREIGLSLLTHFSSQGKPSKYGNFGVIEATDQDPLTAPKQRGLFDFIDDFATCDVDARYNDATCAQRGVCNSRGHCLAPSLRWGARESDECSCYFANSGVNCSIFTPVEFRSCGESSIRNNTRTVSKLP